MYVVGQEKGVACHGMCGGQRTILESMWIPGIKLRFPGLCSKYTFTHPLNHLSGPSFLFKKKKVSAHSENFTDIESYTLECLRLYGRALPLHTPSGNLWKFLPVSIQHFFLMSMQTNNSKHSFFLFQENSQMFQGRPCKDMSILNEYFPHGITNGASWYNVPGKDHSLPTWIFLFSRVLLLVNDLFQFWERTIVFFFFKKKAQMI